MDKFAEPIALPEKEDNPKFFNRILKIAAYPFAAISGLWVMEKEVHEAVYHNLKRYHAFDDLLTDLQPENNANVAQRVSNTIEKEEFLSRSVGTKTAYSKAVGERMAHMGLGNDLKDFPAKWRYISSGGKRSAVIQGMTSAGIAIGALLTIANSKSLIDFFSNKKEPDEKAR